MIADQHIHTFFSGDSEEDCIQIAEFAAESGMGHICITDHYDLDYPEEGFTFDVHEYYNSLSYLRQRMNDKIDIGIGIEAGLIPQRAEDINNIVKSAPFDFVIGSSHLVNGIDPYYPEYFEGRSVRESIMAYFLSILENIRSGVDFDVYGHLDYMVRYAPQRDVCYSYSAFSDIIDDILCQLVDRGKGIEVNSSGWRAGLFYPHPHPDIIKRYRELGGEIITVGSDAHVKCDVGCRFDDIKQILKNCGFKYYTVFRNRKPEFINLDN